MATYMQGALKSGTSASEYTNVGYAVFTQTGTLQAASAAAVDLTFTLPSGSQIVAIYVDSSVAWTASGTVTFTAGTASAGTQYITSIDLKTVVRGAPTLTAAQVGVMADISTNTTLVCTATTSTGANATGTTKVTVMYVPKS